MVSKFQSLQMQAKKHGKDIQELGQKYSTYLTLPLAGLAALSVSAFHESEQAIAQVRVGVESMGGAAGYTLDELGRKAEDLMNNSLFDDDDIMRNVTAQMVSFGNVSGEVFDRAQQVTLDLATRLDGDLKGAAIQVGKALNDPEHGFTALSRAGIQFTEDQKSAIRSMVDAKDMAGAQALMLNELERQFAGSAKAASEAGMGGWLQAKNSLGELMEEVGGLITRFMDPLLDRFKRLVTWFKDLPSGTKAVIVAIAALAASIGPLMIAFATMSKLFSGFGSAGSLMALKVVAIVAAVAALAGVAIYLRENWDAVKDWWESLWLTLRVNMLEAIASMTNRLNDFMRSLGVDVMQGFADRINYELGNAKAYLEMFDGYVKKDFKSIKDTFADVFPELSKFTAGGSGGGDGDGSGGAGSGALKAKLREKQTRVDLELKPVKVFDTNLEGLNVQLQGIGLYKQAHLDLQETMGQSFEANTAAKDQQEEIWASLSDMMMQTGQALTSSFEALFSGNEDGFKQLTQMIGSLIKRLIAAAIAAAILFSLMSGLGLAGAGKSISSFGDVFKGLSGFKFFADGGIAMRPTLGVFGEAGPEAVIPLNKLGTIMNNGSGSKEMNVNFGPMQLHGERLVAVVDRTEYMRSR